MRPPNQMAMGSRHSSEQSWGSPYRWHPGRIAKIEVDTIKGSWSSPHRRSPGRTKDEAEGETGISWGASVSYTGSVLRDGWR